MKKNEADLAYTALAVLGALALANLTSSQREASRPPPRRATIWDWATWGAPLAMSVAHMLPLWQEMSEPAKRRKTDDERLRRVAALGSTAFGLFSPAFTKGPAIKTSQALTLVQSGAALSKDLLARRRPSMPVISILPLVAWLGFAAGRGLRWGRSR